MKRYDIIALLLVIYLAVMAYFGRGMLLSGNYWEYFSIIGVTLLVIFILRWAMKRREKIREELLSNVFRNWRKKDFSIKSQKYYHCYI